MAVVPLANPLGAIRAYLLPNPTQSSRIFPAERKPPIFLNLRRDILRVCCSNLKEDTVEVPFKEDAQNSEESQWAIFKPWDVPWDWKVTAYVMMPYLMSIFLTGLVESERQQGPLGYSANMLAQLNTTDELAIKIFMDQLLKSVVKLLVLYIFVSPHQPLPDDVFSLEWTSPFNFKNGWILWAVGGLSVASFVAFVVKALISGLYAGHADNETEPLVRLLPMIGSSNIRLPMTFSVVASSTIFTLAHQSPGKSPEIFIFGIVLGLIYAQTRNLLVPITMHALWNWGVILLLTFLHSQGYDINKFVL